MKNNNEQKNTSFDQLKEYELSKTANTPVKEKSDKTEQTMTKLSGYVLASIAATAVAVSFGNGLNDLAHPENSSAMHHVLKVVTDDKDNFEMKYIFLTPEKSYLEGEQKTEDKIVNGCYIITSNNNKINKDFLYKVYTPKTFAFEELKKLEVAVINNKNIEFQVDLTVAEIAQQYSTTQIQQNAEYMASL